MSNTPLENESSPQNDILEIEAFVKRLNSSHANERKVILSEFLSRLSNRLCNYLLSSLIQYRMLNEFLETKRSLKQSGIWGGEVIQIFNSMGEADAISWLAGICESREFTVALPAIIGKLLDEDNFDRALEIARHGLESGIPIQVSGSQQFLDTSDLESPDWWKQLRPELATYLKLRASIADGSIDIREALSQFDARHSHNERLIDITKVAISHLVTTNKSKEDFKAVLSFAGRSISKAVQELDVDIQAQLRILAQGSPIIANFFGTDIEGNRQMLREYLRGSENITDSYVTDLLEKTPPNDVYQLLKESPKFQNLSDVERGVERVIWCYDQIRRTPSEAVAFEFLKGLPPATSTDAIRKYLDSCIRWRLAVNERHLDRMALTYIFNSDFPNAEIELESLWGRELRPEYAEISLIFAARDTHQPIFARRAISRLIASGSNRIDDRVIVVAVRAHWAADAAELARFVDFILKAGYSLGSRASQHVAECLAEADMLELLGQLLNSLKQTNRGGLGAVYAELILGHATRGATNQARQYLREFFRDVSCYENRELVIQRLQILGDASLLEEIRVLSELDGKAFAQPDQNIRMVTKTITRRVRDPEVPARVKALYGGRCQICQQMLLTTIGSSCEGAHIRPLGRPHFGYDLVENCLCLCPNHHRLLDGLGIFITTDFQVVDAFSEDKIGRLAIDPSHRVSAESLSHHRARVIEAHSILSSHARTRNK
jgi:hypothetical protein